MVSIVDDYRGIAAAMRALHTGVVLAADDGKVEAWAKAYGLTRLPGESKGAFEVRVRHFVLSRETLP